MGGTTFKLLEKLVERAFKHVIRAMDLDELAGLSHKLACGVFAPASEFADIVNAEQPIALSGTSGESRCGRLSANLWSSHDELSFQ